MGTSTTPSLAGTLLATAARLPTRTAFSSPAETYSFGDLADNVRAAAAALAASGVAPGDRFAILCRNSSTILELTFAASLSGAVLVPLNFRLAPREIGEIVADCRPRLIFVEDDWTHLLADVAERPPVVRVAEGDQTPEYRQWRDTGAARGPTSRRPATPDDVVVQMYTTGTTGRPKGVMISERNLDALATKAPLTFGASVGSRYLALLPMFHISGLGTPIGVLCAGGEVVLSSGTSAAAVLCDLTAHRITHVNLVPSLISLLLDDPATHQADLSDLEMLMYGAAPSSDTTIDEAMKLLPHCRFLHGYGLTECTGGVAYTAPRRLGDPSGVPGSVGTAALGCELRIVDPRSLRDMSPGEPGEVWVRSEQNTQGYWNRPEETAALYAEAGWLRTGDIGVMDADGVLTLKDRLKDMIISGGENVYSTEVENVIAGHPAVAEVAVYGIPDPKWGEAVKATVTLRRGAAVDVGELREYVRERLAHYKCPKMIDIADDLPRSANGKILKRVLRAKAEA